MAFSIRADPSQCHVGQLIVKILFYFLENQRAEFRATTSTRNGGSGKIPERRDSEKGKPLFYVLTLSKWLAFKLHVCGADS